MTAQFFSVLTLWVATMLYGVALVATTTRLARLADEKAGGAVKPTSRSRRIGQAALAIGALFHLVGTVARGFEAGHVPWSNMYEFTVSGALAAVLVFLLVHRKYDLAYLAPGVAGLAVVSLGIAMVVLYERATGLQPALQSVWIIIHVVIAVIGTGVFCISALTAVLQLAQIARAEGAAWTGSRRFAFLQSVPGEKTLESITFRLNAVGFVMWTFTLIAGAVWAEHSWGRYWNWDPKEVWTLVVWLLYAAYLHARATQGWSGKRAAYLSLAGFVALVFNFTIVNLVFQSLHSYA